MNRDRALQVLVGAACGLFTIGARAATLQPVNDWGASGVPSTVHMSIYVPDALADNPPILVLAHYCGGSASAVFGQAQGGGIVEAADQYGFIMVVPQAENTDGTGRCWDVGSTNALTRDGGGDTEAIAQMVQYTLAEYGANPDRVYVTGDSSGGMMTQALLALYPDVFKAGAAFAGVPAGCWAASNPDGSWSGPCAGGTVTHTPEEWGDIARDMSPAYTGQRPRVQLFHGDADDTIKYPNHVEAIKQWTNVLGLSEEPTSTETVQLGSHQATRERWEDSCGYVVLDAFSSQNGDHGPSDALFEAEYVIPFLGLDQAGPTDPGQCASDSGDSTASTSVGTTTSGTTTGGTVTSDAATSSSATTTGGGFGSTGSSSATSSSTDGNASSSTGPLTNGTGGASSASSTSGTPTTAVATTGSVATGNSATSAALSSTDGSSATGQAATTDGGSGATPEDGGCGCRAAGKAPRALPLGVFGLFALTSLLPLLRRSSARRRASTR